MATLRDQAKTSIPRVIRNSVSSLSGGQSNSLGIPLQASLLKKPLLALQKLTVSNCPARCGEGEAGAGASQRCDQGPQHPGVSSQRETCEPPYIILIYTPSRSTMKMTLTVDILICNWIVFIDKIFDKIHENSSLSKIFLYFEWRRHFEPIYEHSCLTQQIEDKTSTLQGKTL